MTSNVDLVAAVDIGRWLRDYGAIVAGLAALAVGAFNAMYAVSGSRQSKRQEWQREIRLPVYLKFASAVEELVDEAGEQWEGAFLGQGVEEKRPDPPLIDDLQRTARRCLAEVELVGPSKVAALARALADAARTYGHRMENQAGGGDIDAVNVAFEEFRNEVGSTADLPR